jgi:MFS family permease
LRNDPVCSDEASVSYRQLFNVPGLSKLVGSTLLARTGDEMYVIVLVLFVLGTFHSPPLAGLVLLTSLVPGLLASPLAGVLLDRRGRVLLMTLDYLVAALSLVIIFVLARAHLLTRPVLLLVVAVGGLTHPLSSVGTRSLFPVMVPRPLWDRANAVDSGGYVVATLIGPALAGLAVALVGHTWALLLPAVASAGGAILLWGLQVPASGADQSVSLVADALGAVRYVWGNRVLRMLAITLSVFNLGAGALSVALPVLVLRRLHAGSTTIGLLFAVMGLAGILAGLATGRMGSEGRERSMLGGACLASALAFAVIAVAPNVVVVALGMAVLGLANGPLDVALFSLRQRATDPAWFGRAFAVSMNLNFAGYPIGAAIAGVVVARSVTGSFALAGGLALLAGLWPLAHSALPAGRARD